MTDAMTPPGTASLGRHVRSLDGVRAIAIIVVLLVHAGAPLFEAGWVGVDLFFALSGFLITTLLLDEHTRVGAISYRDFLARRGLRLMPAYFVYAVVVTYGIWGWSGSVRTELGGWSAGGLTASLWTYTINFAPKDGIWNGQDLSVHLWSLAVEQQYYLVWPLVVIALASRPRRLLAAGVAITLLELTAFVFWPGESLYKTVMLFTRGFTLAMASTIAIAAFYWREQLQRAPRALVNLFGMLAILCTFGFTRLHVWSDDLILTVLLPFMSFGFSLWIARLWYGPPIPRWLERALLNPAMQYIGKVSYGVYLYHEMVRVAVWYWGKPLMLTWSPAAGYLTRLAAYILISVALAGLSYEWIEKSFLRLRTLFRPDLAPGGRAPRHARQAPTGT